MGGIVKAVGNLFSGGGDSPAAPPAPDYRGAAEATAASNREAATVNTWANRPTIRTPWGTQSWTSELRVDPATGQKVTGWSQNTHLNPVGQKALDSQMAISQGRLDVANQQLGSVRDAYSRPVDYNSVQGWGKAYNGAGVNTNYRNNTLNNSGAMQTSGIGGSGMYQPVADSIYSQATSRLDPRFNQAQSDLDAKLAAQGISRNSNAFNRAQNNLSMQRNDAYNQAMNSAYQGGVGAAQTFQGMDINRMNTQNSALMNQQNMDLNANNFYNNSLNQGNTAQQQAFNQSQTVANYNNTLRQAQIAEQQQKRSQALNDMNALASGQQVSMPNMPSFNTATQYGGVNYTGAAQNQAQFNQDQANATNAQNANNQSGLFGLLGTGMQAASMFGFSDERLKRDIRQIGSIMGGKLGVYKYRFVGSTKEVMGLMAQEVQKHFPECVYQRKSGYLMVDYGKLLGA